MILAIGAVLRRDLTPPLPSTHIPVCQQERATFILKKGPHRLHIALTTRPSLTLTSVTISPDFLPVSFFVVVRLLFPQTARARWFIWSFTFTKQTQRKTRGYVIPLYFNT